MRINTLYENQKKRDIHVNVILRIVTILRQIQFDILNDDSYLYELNTNKPLQGKENV